MKGEINTPGKMKKLPYYLGPGFITLLLLATVMAQGQRSDFSGTWILTEEKSKLAEAFSMAPRTLFIDQEDNSIHMQRHSTWQGENYTIDDTYALDGSLSENEGWMTFTKKSVAIWSPDSAILTITTRVPMQDGEEMTVTEEITMENGNLVIESTASSSRGTMTEEFVFESR